MSKNKTDRRTSNFKAKDNIEIILNRIIKLIETSFVRGITESSDGGSWSANGDFAEIKIKIDTPYKNLDGKCVILQCSYDNRVDVTTMSMWLMDVFRTKLIDATFQLMEHVNTANGIHPICTKEFYERRINQDLAITDCYHILHILQRGIDNTHLKPSNMEDIVELIEEEIRLIKGWRRAEYRKLNAIKERESE